MLQIADGCSAASVWEACQLNVSGDRQKLSGCAQPRQSSCMK